ncbi:MAG: 2-keto-4-pentenoate hydratase [Alphaproteobacteria bacterium]|nr:2-keto-4-pentenoate hydratase [Alphaproteobacteria bacterium]
MTFDAAAAIDEFWQARSRGEYFPRAWFDRLSLDQAYRIQLGLIDRRVARGERQIGWKVGLTAKPIQEQFGFHEPVFGCILESVASGTPLKASALIQPGFESELCLRMGATLAGRISMTAARAAVAGVHPALEIIETRGDLSAQIAVAMADNAQQKTVVLGDAVPLADKRLDQVACRVDMNGATVVEGTGAAVLGDPLNSVVWLAGKLAEFGRSIRAGDIIMTGSFVRQFPLTGGDQVRVEFAGVGVVETRVG